MFASEKAALLGDVPTFIVAKALVTPRGGKADKTIAKARDQHGILSTSEYGWKAA